MGLFDTDVSGRLVAGDQRFRQLALAGAPIGSGRAPWTNAAPDARAEIEVAWARAITLGGEFDTEATITQSNGVPARVRFVIAPRHAPDGTLTGYSGVVIRAAVAEPDDHRDRHIARMSDAFLAVDADSMVVFANPSAFALVGLDPASASVGESALRNLALAIHDQVPRSILDSDAVWRGEVGVRRSDGRHLTLDVDVVTRRRDDGSIDGFTAACRDISTSSRLQAELVHQATHDPLTGLPNRLLFLRRLADAIDRGRVRRTSIAVLYVDIDQLKDVNDTLGHESGDILITAIGRRIVNATRPGDVVARHGGDEFLVLCEGADDDSALDIAERIRTAVTEPVVLQGVETRTGASIGIVVEKGDGATSPPAEAALDMVHDADTAMYHAKSRGRSRCEVYSTDMRDRARQRAALAADLEQALAREQMHLVFQPIADATSGRTVAVEALLRWSHPERGLLTPSAFIDLAEESGFIVPIGRWVLTRAVESLRDWITERKVDPHFRMHVNVSPRQLADPGFVEFTSRLVAENGIRTDGLVLEFGERALMRDDTLRALQSIERLGVGLTIDDFGAGYSSLVHLRSCAADYLKLDGSFVRSLGNEERDTPIVRSVIQLAHSLDMAVIAEWVTTPDERERVQSLGCDFVQGHLIGHPVGAADLLNLLSR
ncbi:MAG: putative bifunctional diguanylate cyclase/phosphodiesterase [Actinomycetota bacterium]